MTTSSYFTTIYQNIDNGNNQHLNPFTKISLIDNIPSILRNSYTESSVNTSKSFSWTSFIYFIRQLSPDMSMLCLLRTVQSLHPFPPNRMWQRKSSPPPCFFLPPISFQLTDMTREKFDVKLIRNQNVGLLLFWEHLSLKQCQML